MIKNYHFIVLLLACQTAICQVELQADGPGDTYALISSVLAPGYNPIETPDCNHQDFGEHIDEIFDADLNDFVFRFHIHTTPDDDRCINFDRQRNEIKSYDQSPDNLLGIEGEKVVYKWMFKLSDGFQSSSKFTHLHQLKSVGGSLASMPMYTLTTRKGNPDQLELRYAETDDQITLIKTDLEPFIGTWLEVTETIKYGIEGSYELHIQTVEDQIKLFEYANESITNWRPGADFVRPKWGIYRSLVHVEDLRDEMVLFANFSIVETEIVSIENQKPLNDWSISYSQIDGNLLIQNYPDGVNFAHIFSTEGLKVLTAPITLPQSIEISLPTISTGVYIVHLIGDDLSLSKQFFVTK